MSDIRKRIGAKGTTYQVRYPCKSAQSGYAYETFDTRKEALAFRENAKARLTNGPRAKGIRTVEDAVQQWLDTCEKEGRDGRDPVTPHTLKGYRQRAQAINAYQWTKALNELTAPDIVEFRSWLLRTYSRDKARKVLSLFHSTVLEMVTRGVLAHDIVSGVNIRGSSRYDEPVKIPTEQQIHDLLAAADRLANSDNQQVKKTWERYRPMLYLAVDTGMRPQEYLAVPKHNLTAEGIKVDRALESGGKKISVTKTPAGRRTIDLSPHVRQMVLHYATDLAAKSEHDLIFPTASGHWQSIDNWAKRGFAAACIEAGLYEVVVRNGKKIERPTIKPYDLRHFYASMLIEQRLNLKRIQYLMGHKDIQTTLNVYGHLIERVESQSESKTGMLAKLTEKTCGKSVASPL